MPTFKSLTLSITIDRPWQAVYDYAADPANLTHWAAGLGSDFSHDGDKWSFRGPGGDLVTMTFAGRNPYGVLDHDVFVSEAQIVHMPVRVMPNGDGADVTIRVLQTPDLSDAEFERDAAAIRKDLATLKSLLEPRGNPPDAA